MRRHHFPPFDLRWSAEAAFHMATRGGYSVMVGLPGCRLLRNESAFGRLAAVRLSTHMCPSLAIGGWQESSFVVGTAFGPQ
jgi:hypothetical protein